ncbi:MAG: hypothetical protein KatS3mg082_1460 [Nitrospiraceae bacterium]|nr:MAG: hypothetical protein KatS3mg082_1460 [Nitrospiraceae bacterium]
MSAVAAKYGLPESLLLAVIEVESGFQHTAVSRKGAIGAGQLMPQTAQALNVDPWEPTENIEGAARYLREMLDRFGDPVLALAAYNAGPEAVEAYNGVPPYAETRSYVRKVLNRWRTYHGFLVALR